MKRVLCIFLIFIPFIASCSLMHKKAILDSLNTEGYYLSRVGMTNQGERLYVKFYYGTGEYEGEKRVKICPAKTNPDFTSIRCRDTWFTVLSDENAIKYRAVDGRVSYTVKHKLEDLEYQNN